MFLIQLTLILVGFLEVRFEVEVEGEEGVTHYNYARNLKFGTEVHTHI